MNYHCIIPVPEIQFGSLLRATIHVNEQLQQKHQLPAGCAASIHRTIPATNDDPATVEALVHYKDIFILWELGKHFGYILGKTNL